jgi:hypothetical protein
MGKLSSLVLIIALAGCCCPPACSSQGARSGDDPSSGAFSFLGGLRCFFGSEDDSANQDTRTVKQGDLVTKPAPVGDDADHAAALTIR